MPKYIDCEPLINNFSGGESMKSMSESIADARFVEALKKAPAADVAEVVHGEWLEGNKRQPCSECLYRGARAWSYCPNCGAKMDGKEHKNGNA